jgi:hypothetical protein
LNEEINLAARQREPIAFLGDDVNGSQLFHRSTVSLSNCATVHG